MVYRLGIFFCLGLLFLSTATAQWSNVAPNLLGPIPTDKEGFGSIAYKDGLVWVGRTELWMSADTGKTWTKMHDSFGGTITQIEFFDKNTGLLSSMAGIFHTIDQGKTWVQIHQGGDCYGVSFCGSSQNIIAACDYAGLFYSTDAGQNWNVGNTGGHILTCVGRSDGSALEHSGDFVFITNDFGKSWQTLGGVEYDSFTLALDSSSIDNVYLMSEVGHPVNTINASVFHSIDGGASWADLSIHQGKFFSGSLSVTRTSVYAQSLSNGVFRSIDSGQSWQSICGPSNNIDTRLLCAVNDNIIFAADGQGSIWLTAPSKGGDTTFTLSSSRIINDSVNVTVAMPIYLNCKTTMPSFDMVVHYPSFPLTYLRSESISGTSVDIPGQQWSGRAKIHFDAADLAARKDSLIGYSIFTWLPYEYDCAHITFDSIVANVLDNPCSGTPAILASATGGYIGTYPSCGLALETDVDPPQFVITPGKNSFSDSIEVNDGRSTDEGLRSISWIAEPGTDTSKIVVLPVTPVIMPCFNDKIDHLIRVVQRDSTAAGCYDFTFTDCLGHQSFTKICMTAHIESGVGDAPSFILALESNHPNPFSHLTTFTYSTPQYGMVTLSLNDVLGREQALIFGGIQEPGRYSIDFDGSKLPSGNYIVRLDIGGKVISRHVIIER